MLIYPSREPRFLEVLVLEFYTEAELTLLIMVASMFWSCPFFLLDNLVLSLGSCRIKVRQLALVFSPVCRCLSFKVSQIEIYSGRNCKWSEIIGYVTMETFRELC